MSSTELEIREYPEHPRLGRKIAVLDSRSRRFAAVGSLVDPSLAPRTKTWRTYPRAFDQGRTSECTCYAAKRLLNCAPIRASIEPEVRLQLDPTTLYTYAQTIDEWPGEDYDGTSVLAAAKSAQHAGLISGYKWCFGLDDVLRVASWYGPVEIGVTWYESMFDTTDTGRLIVDTDSDIAGGHAVAIIGVNVSNQTVVISNSWGRSWGDDGRCYMKWSDLGLLLEDWGEAVTFLKATT
jgi:hypothetical protein